MSSRWTVGSTIRRLQLRIAHWYISMVEGACPLKTIRALEVPRNRSVLPVCACVHVSSGGDRQQQQHRLAQPPSCSWEQLHTLRVCVCVVSHSRRLPALY